MTILPTIRTGGGNIEYAIESALGTPGSYYDWRQCEDSDPVFPQDTREVRPVSSKGYWDPTEREAQLSFKKYRENYLTVATYLTNRLVSDGSPQWVSMMEAAGCTVVSANATPTTLDTYTNTGSYSLTADKSGVGEVGILELSNGTHWPQLTYSDSGAATYNLVPSMCIPSASESSKNFYQGWTVVPPKGVQVTTSKTMAFRVSSYYNTSTESGSASIYTGCAPSEFKEIVFEPGMPLKLEATFHCANPDFDQSGIDLTAEAYLDRVAVPILDGGGSQFLMGWVDVSSWPQTATRTLGFRKATFRPGIKTICVPEMGATTSVNSLGGYLAYYTGASLELTMDVEKEWWTRLETSGSQTAKYCELVQPASAITGCALGLWMPKCYLVGKPTADLWGEKEMTVTFTVEPTSFGATATTKAHQGNAPWYLGMSPYVA